MARLGAVVTGVDPVESSIVTAEEHARADPAIADRISYRCCSMEELLGEEFDCVVVSEVVEHVTEKETFLSQVSQLVKVSLPGLFIVNTFTLFVIIHGN